MTFANVLTVTRNEYGTWFLDYNGTDLGDSASWNRKRFLHVRGTTTTIPAPELTTKRVEKDPGLFVAALNRAGITLPADTVVFVNA